MPEDLETRLHHQNGPVFRSQGERNIAQLLEKVGIRYIYEPPVIIQHHGLNRIWYPDFMLPEYGLYIEYYGVLNNPDYDRGVMEKQKVYGQSGITIIPVYPVHTQNNLSQYLSEQVQGVLRERQHNASRAFRGIEYRTRE